MILSYRSLIFWGVFLVCFRKQLFFVLFRLDKFYLSIFKFSESFLCYFHFAIEPIQSIFKFWLLCFFSPRIFIWFFHLFIYVANIFEFSTHFNCVHHHLVCFTNSCFKVLVRYFQQMCHLAIDILFPFPMWVMIFLVLHILTKFKLHYGHLEYYGILHIISIQWRMLIFFFFFFFFFSSQAAQLGWDYTFSPTICWIWFQCFSISKAFLELSTSVSYGHHPVASSKIWVVV